jgi:hypothetical protein
MVATWTFSGEGSAFTVVPESALKLASLEISAASGVAFSISAGATVTTASNQLLRSGRSPQQLACASLATGMGEQLLPCGHGEAGGTLFVGGPVYISTSGVGFAMGDTKYVGEDAEVFETALSAREPGQHTLHMTKDAVHSAQVDVGSAMGVTIVGDPSQPSWIYRDGPDIYTFSVGAHGHLAIIYLHLMPPR